MTDNSGWWWTSLLGAVATLTVVPLIIAVNILLGGWGPGVELHHSEFTAEGARKIGDDIGVDWRKVDLEQFRAGLDVELEHGLQDSQTNVTSDDPLLTGKIAWAHLKEVPDYYTRLKKVEGKMSNGKGNPDHEGYVIEETKTGRISASTRTYEEAVNWIRNNIEPERRHLFYIALPSGPPEAYWFPFSKGHGNPDHEAKIEARFESLKERREAKQREWLSQGVPPTLVEQALNLADRHVEGLGRTYLEGLGGGEALSRRFLELNYPKGLSVAQRWLEEVRK